MLHPVENCELKHKDGIHEIRVEEILAAHVQSS